MSDRHLVFVYGTLRQGQGNHRLLAAAQFLGVYRTDQHAPREHFVLVDCGAFPALVPVADDAPDVVGELYTVDDDELARLDALEGVPHLYERRMIDVVDDETGCRAVAWTYYQPETRRRPVIASGDWLRRHVCNDCEEPTSEIDGYGVPRCPCCQVEHDPDLEAIAD